MGKRYSFLLSSLLSLVVLLYVMLSYYSRLATDDYYFIWDVKQVGIWQSLYSHYLEWSGRFSAGLMADIVYKYLGLNQEYYTFYPLVSLALLVSGLYLALSNIADFLNLPVPKFLIGLSTGLFTALFFFLSFDIGESWFWYCSLCTYLWSVIAFIWGLSAIFSKRSNFVTYPVIILSFVYIGGASEFNSAMYSLFFLIVFIFQWKKQSRFSDLLKQPVHKKLLAAFISLEISFLILLVAPGNYLRDGLFPEHQFFYSFFITAKSIVKFCILYLPFKIPYLFAFALPFILIGKEISKNKTVEIKFNMFFKKMTIGLIAILLIFWFLVAFVMVEAGPPRVLIFVSFLVSIYASAVCFMLGYTHLLTEKQFQISARISLIVGFSMMIFNLINQYNIAKTYSQANDERIETIIALNKTIKKDSLVYLKPLPKCGMLYSAEISADTNHFTNKELRIGYNLKYRVASKKD